MRMFGEWMGMCLFVCFLRWGSLCVMSSVTRSKVKKLQALTNLYLTNLKLVSHFWSRNRWGRGLHLSLSRKEDETCLHQLPAWAKWSSEVVSSFFSSPRYSFPSLLVHPHPLFFSSLSRCKRTDEDEERNSFFLFYLLLLSLPLSPSSLFSIHLVKEEKSFFQLSSLYRLKKDEFVTRNWISEEKRWEIHKWLSLFLSSFQILCQLWS